ncbi:hypothetical protein, partial [Lactobacillus equicursoris]|uniref:hypothetical protein n=1 Tax=Lactobacillus equicursoris TaxID=420645 RepID=UPI003995604F
MSNKHFNQKALAASLVAVSLAVGLTQLPQVQAVLPVAVKTQKAEATAPEEFYTIRTQADLDKFLKLSDDVRNNFNGFKFENKGTITFPANYQLNVMRFVRFWLSDKSNGTIDFNNTTIAINRHAKGSVRPADGHAYWPVVGKLNWYVSGDHHNQVIKNLDVHGSVVTKYANGKVSDDGQGGMQVILLHAKNINFQNMQFHQAQIFNRHVFDSLGSRGITWDNCKFYGYGGSNFTKNTWNDIYKLESSPSAGVKGHSVLSEAIQLDVATADGASHDPEVNKTNFPSAGSTIFDGASTENATIKNCYFGPEINGVSGGAIVNQAPGKALPTTTIPYGATVGSHGVDDAHKNATYKNISIYNSTFEKTATATNIPVSYYKVMAPIHLRYVASQSTSDVNSLKAWSNTFKNVINRGDNGIPDTLSGIGYGYAKRDIWLYKSWSANAPTYLATTSNTFPKLNSHGSKITKAVLADSKGTTKKPAAKKTTKQPATKKATKKTAKKPAAKKATKKTAKKPAAKKTTKKTAKKPAAKKATKKTAKKPAAKKATKKTAKKPAAKKATKKTAKKPAAKKATKKTAKKPAAKKATKKTTKKAAKKTTKKATKKAVKKT